MTRRVLLVVVLLCGIAQADRTRRVVRSYATCDMGVCNEAQKKLYDEEPTLELVTMGIGSLAWERHGHIAMCVRWHDQSKDICFNYGIGSFEKPLSMAWGFFRGTNSFWAGEQTIESLIQIYAGRNRTVWVQPLPLSGSEKDEVLDALYRDTAPMRGRELLRPEKWRNSQNLHYAYDHFADNCTTRVRDILDQATKGKLSKFAQTQQTDGKTLRELARDGFYGMKMFLLITDVAMGRITDHVPDYWERMFLPQFLREAAFKVWPEIPPIIIYQRDPSLERPELTTAAGLHDDADGNGLMDAEEDRDHASGRFFLAFLLILLTAPALLTRYFGKLPRLGMTVAVLPQFLVGAILWFLAIISPLPYVMWNESLLILFPADILLLFLPPAKRKRYAQGRVAMLVLVGLLMLIGVLHQPIFELLLWPLIPNAIIGFWRPEWSRKGAAKADDKKVAKADDKKTGDKAESKKTEDKKADGKKADEKVDDKKADEKKVNEKKTDDKKVNEKKTDEKKPDDKKADDKKAELKKPDEKKPDQKKVDDKAESKKVDEKKVDEKKVDEKKVDEKKVDEKKVDEKKVDEKKVDEKKVDEKKPDDKKADDKKAELKKPDEKKPDQKKVDDKAESKKVDEKKVDEKKVDEKKVDEKKVDEKKVDEKKVDEKKVDEKKVDEKVDDKADSKADDKAESKKTDDESKAG